MQTGGVRQTGVLCLSCLKVSARLTDVAGQASRAFVISHGFDLSSK